MSHLIRDRQIVLDDYRYIAEDGSLPATGKIIVSLAHWQKIMPAPDSLVVGIQIPNTLSVEEYWPILGSRPLVALEFPSFADGRAYSQARLLRDMGYTGEVRATGLAVVRDQLQSMERCGINSFQLRSDQPIEQALGAFGDFSLHYQPGTDPTPAVVRLRT